MDAEAVPLPDGTPTGLRGYYAFRRGSYRGGRGLAWENTWTERLAELLPAYGYTAECQCRYPGQRKTCDLVLSALRMKSMWIEVKGSWRSTIDDADLRRDIPNTSFKKHLYTTAADVNKLQKLRSGEASHLGLLLIGFDTRALPITDDDLSIIRVTTKGWREASAGWNDHAWHGRRVRCWFWWRSSSALRPTGKLREELDSTRRSRAPAIGRAGRLVGEWFPVATPSSILVRLVQRIRSRSASPRSNLARFSTK